MLLRIDELSREDHSFISPDDQCFYLREYTTEGFEARPDNQLVFNLKCPINHGNPNRLYYKRKAINIAAADIAEALRGLPTISETVFIPIPPSKVLGTPEYDPRVREMLRVAESSCGIRVVEALTCIQARNTAHESSLRPTVDEIASNLQVVSTAWVDAKYVALFDDLLVTGAQFKAASRVLRLIKPTANIVGLFLVRRTFP